MTERELAWHLFRDFLHSWVWWPRGRIFAWGQRLSWVARSSLLNLYHAQHIRLLLSAMRFLSLPSTHCRNAGNRLVKRILRIWSSVRDCRSMHLCINHRLHLVDGVCAVVGIDSIHQLPVARSMLSVEGFFFASLTTCGALPPVVDPVATGSPIDSCTTSEDTAS